MGTVVGIFDAIRTRPSGRGVAAAAVARPEPDGRPGFTARDLADLGLWSSDDRRVAICTSDMGSFAMLYREGAPWASWGLVRQDRSILLWDCVTLADIGHYSSMADAMRELTQDGEVAPPSNVLLFAAAARARSAVSSCLGPFAAAHDGLA